MIAGQLSEAPTAMPVEWANTSVVRHVGDRFSDEALAEEHKTSIDLGVLDVEACRGGERPVYLKYKHVAAEVELTADVPPALADAHRRFINAARLILDEEMYHSSFIEFTYRDDPVLPGTQQRAMRPHIDGHTNGMGHELRLLAIACSDVPTVRRQGQLSRSQLDERGQLISVHNLNRRFRRDPIDLGRLILVPPALLHEAGRTSRNLEEPVNQIFLRWQLKTLDS